MQIDCASSYVYELFDTLNTSSPFTGAGAGPKLLLDESIFFGGGASGNLPHKLKLDNNSTSEIPRTYLKKSINAIDKNIITNNFNDRIVNNRTTKIQYLEKKNTYNTFTTILRQICNFNKIIYTTQIKYDKSIYNICYYIFF